jgi:3-isopropylmalate/(R)-2-methylmalate dehydratase large subunit
MRREPFDKSKIIEGRVWLMIKDHIETILIYPEKYLAIKDFNEIGQYTFNDLEGYENFAQQVFPGDILIAGENFGCGPFDQHAIDCFVSLGIQAIIAKSFCETYEKQAIKAGFPVMTYVDFDNLRLENWDKIRVNFVKGIITNLRNNRTTQINPFSDQQMKIYLLGGDF